ncbi:MAG TPA: DMT family transporter [Spirochaetia bacterium]|nr:DMT family transporter [Spirochaetia bacterium]
MLENRIGEIAALATAICWTATALAFEAAGRRIGSLAVNIIRLAIAFLVFCVLSMIVRGAPVPVDAAPRVWFWLSLSGIVGFVLGDLFLFQAFILIGSRVSMLIYASVPPLTAALGWLVLGESLNVRGFVGMVLTLAGIAVVILQRSVPASGSDTDVVTGSRLAVPRGLPDALADRRPGTRARVGFTHPVRGILYAFGGALGQAGGLVLSKLGAPTYDAFGATQIRGIAGIIGFALIVTVARRWKPILDALRNLRAMTQVSVGAFFGPFLGVSLGLYAVQHTSTGIASTIMALTPVLIIVPSVLVLKQRVTLREIGGAVLAVGGTALLFL